MKTEQLNALADKLMEMPTADFILYETTLQDLKEGDDFYKRLSWYICNEAAHKNAKYLEIPGHGLNINDVNIAIARICEVHHQLLTMQLLDWHGRYDEDHINIISLNVKQLRLWKKYEKKCLDVVRY